MLVPIVDTDRLRLRAHRMDDLPACLSMWNDVLEAGPGKRTVSEEEIWWRILRYAGHWSLSSYGYWVIEEKVSGRFVGEVGLGDFKRDIQPSLGGAPEMGWILARWAQGAGRATEAVAAALAWADRGLNMDTVCLIHPDNALSIRVADKCGYRPEHRTTYKDEPVLIFRRSPARP